MLVFTIVMFVIFTVCGGAGGGRDVRLVLIFTIVRFVTLSICGGGGGAAEVTLLVFEIVTFVIV